jgi:hypothetical protein
MYDSSKLLPMRAMVDRFCASTAFAIGVTPSTSPIINLRVRLPQACGCGSHIATIGSSSGPHEHRLDCTHCGTWRQWLGRAEAHFISVVSKKFGAPTEPIVLRTVRP